MQRKWWPRKGSMRLRWLVLARRSSCRITWTNILTTLQTFMNSSRWMWESMVVMPCRWSASIMHWLTSAVNCWRVWVKSLPWFRSWHSLSRSSIRTFRQPWSVTANRSWSRRIRSRVNTISIWVVSVVRPNRSVCSQRLVVSVRSNRLSSSWCCRNARRLPWNWPISPTRVNSSIPLHRNLAATNLRRRWCCS